MGDRVRKDRGLKGKLLVSTALLVTTAFYAYWQKTLEVPRVVAEATPVQLHDTQAAPSDPSSGIGGYVFHEGPAAAAIAMPKGKSVADGEYVSQEWESGFGTVKLKVHIQKGRFTDVQYLLVPDERQRSEEISHMAKPLLQHEMIHEQKAKVDIITTATYTSFAFQDALTDVVQQATRPPVSGEIKDTHDLAPLYMGSQ